MLLLRRYDGVRSAGGYGGTHTRVVIKAFPISRLSRQVSTSTFNFLEKSYT